MENASKALIIAGAILLAILIISLGLVIFNNARDQVGNANLDEQTIQAFNSKFTTFEGDKVSGTKVNSLIQTVIASNQAEINAGTDKKIKITFPTVTKVGNNDSPTATIDKGVEAKVGNTTVSAKVNPGKTYKVQITYNAGLVTEITVT